MAPVKTDAFLSAIATLQQIHSLVALDNPHVFRSLRGLETAAGEMLSLLTSIAANPSELPSAVGTLEASPQVLRVHVDSFGKTISERRLTPREKTDLLALHTRLLALIDVFEGDMDALTHESRRNRYAEAGYVETYTDPDAHYEADLPPLVVNALRIEITEKTPQQDIAPFQYEMNETRLVVLPLHSVAEGEWASVAAAQRDHLVEVAAQITKSLASSNCSAHLKWAFMLISSKLDDEGAILGLGQAVATAQDVFRAEEPSLMDHLAALLRNQLMGLDRYLSGFEDWRDFMRMSVDVAVDDEDEMAMSDSLTTLSRALAPIATVDPEVVSSLNEAGKWRANGKKSRGGRILAMARTLGNLASTVLKSLGKAVIDESKKIIAVTILTVVASVLAVMLNIPGLQWLPGVIEVAKTLLRLPRQ